MLRIKNVWKIYGKIAALKGVSLTTNKGEWVSIMGPSGSGKTTLLNIIAALDTQTKGSVEIDGIRIDKLNQNKKARFRSEKIGLIFQQYYLIPYLTALENVMLAQDIHSTTDKGAAEKALRTVGLGRRLNHYPSQLSGGEQQRVAIARAIINDPALILADEPTGDLDKANEKVVLDLLKKIHKMGQTLMVVTHNPEVSKIGDRTIYLHHGRVVKTIEGIC